MNKILLAVGVVVIAIGVKMIYDARPIVKMYFSFGEENEAVLGLKIVGFIISIIGRYFGIFQFLREMLGKESTDENNF